jgi:hypothetical protein
VAIPVIVSTHAGNDDPNVIHACINNGSKIVRIVGVSESCLSGETPAHWGIQGPQGAPGINGANGINGTNGTDGKDATRPDGPCVDDVNRYVNCGNGTVTDTVTGLIWPRQADCFGPMSYAAANQAAAGLKAGDCHLTDGSAPGDWRLPTMDEWVATIARAVALGCVLASGPSLTDDAGKACFTTGTGTSFAGVASASFLWSSSSSEINPVSGWFANLYYGYVNSNPKGSNVWVWPVRGGSR